MKKKKKLITRIAVIMSCILTIATLVVVIGVLIAGVKKVKSFKDDIMLIKAELGNVKSDINLLKGQVGVLKTSAKTVGDCIKEKDTEGAKAAKAELDTSLDTVTKVFNKPVWGKLRKFPVVGGIVGDVDELILLANRTSDEIIGPAIVQLEEHPLDSLKAEDGFNVNVINSYIDFIEQLEPTIDEISVKIAGINLGILDLRGTISGYTRELSTMLSSYTDAKEYFPVMKAFFGDGEDKLYLLAAQNTAEIRASGGFPGSIGTIMIQDGILTIGDFIPVYETLPAYVGSEAAITEKEDLLFNKRMRLYWDSDFCPDFERVASIWKIGYRVKQGKTVDGVVSMTPEIVQEMLKCTGKTIQLDNGMELNGNNATIILQKELYYKYFNVATASEASDAICNALFAQAAKDTMEAFVSDFDVSKLKNYADLFKAGVNNRTILMWMADSEEQQLIVDKGLGGKLNQDKNKPEVGVYFGSSDASKMGIFMDIDVEISDPVINADTTRTYDVKVKYTNVITQQEIQTASHYILGNYSGGTLGMVHIFAPAGGTISDFKTNGWKQMSVDTYLDHQLGYMNSYVIYPGTPLEITCKVTTAPGVTTSLGYNKTPTLQNYR